jgi:predicted nucleic acid-binding protein
MTGMELVVDTNVAISAILKAGTSRALLFRPDLKLVSPEKLREEIKKHRQEIIEKSGMKEDLFETAVRLVLSNIRIYSFQIILLS